MFNGGANVCLCGSAVVGKGISDVCAKVRMEEVGKVGKGREGFNCEESWRCWQKLSGKRYSVDAPD
jgi:hypothetical protein